jgi:hypothetical protein
VAFVDTGPLSGWVQGPFSQRVTFHFLGIIRALSTGLAARASAMDDPNNAGCLLGDGPLAELPGHPVGGLYLLNTQGTPNDVCLLGRSLNDSGFRQAELDTLAAVQGSYTNNQHG